MSEKKEKFGDAQEKWQKNEKEVADYYAALRRTLDKIRGQRAKYDPTYIPVFIFFSSVIVGDFVDPSYETIARLLADASPKEFGDFSNEIEPFKKKTDIQLAKEEPKQDDYFLNENFVRDHEKWERDKEKYREFYTTLKDSVEKLKKERVSKDPAYQHIKPKHDGISDLQTLKKRMKTLSLDELESEKRVIESERREWKRRIEASEPKREDYFVFDNYADAFEKWDANGDEGELFYGEVEADIEECIEEWLKDRSSKHAPGKDRANETNDSSVFSDAFSVFGANKSDEVEKAVQQAFDSLDISHCVEKERAFFQEYQKWSEEYEKSKPSTRSNGAADEAIQAWEKGKKNAQFLFNIANEKIDTIIREKPIASAADALLKIERRREKELGAQKAERITKEISKEALIINDYQRICYELDVCDKEQEDVCKTIDQMEKEGADPRIIQDFKKRRDDLRIMRVRIIKRKKEIKPDYSKIKHVREDWRNTESRKQALEILRELFPEREGAETIFPQSYRNTVVQTAKKEGYEAEAQDGLLFYDILMKHYNTGGRTFKVKTFTHDMKEGKEKDLGFFMAKDRSIHIRAFVNSNDFKSYTTYRGTFVHEHGHCLEEFTLGAQRSTKNVYWLLKEQGAEEQEPQYEYIETKISASRQPNLCARIDNYSQKVYFNSYKFPDMPGSGIRYHSSELISTALEYLAYTDPRMKLHFSETFK